MRVSLPSGSHATIPLGYTSLTQAWLAEHDPPHPANFTNALGTIDDHLHDVDREHPQIEQLIRDENGISFSGPTITSLACLELGVDQAPATVALDRADAEEVFRLVATESAADRAHNPGLPSKHVSSIIATCCVVLSVMRRYHLEQVTLLTRAAGGR